LASSRASSIHGTEYVIEQFRRFEKANYSERHSPCSHRLRPSRAPCFAGRSASNLVETPSTLQRFVLWSPRAISPSICHRHPAAPHRSRYVNQKSETLQTSCLNPPQKPGEPSANISPEEFPSTR